MAYPAWLSHLNHKHLPNRALVILTIIGVLIGSMFPFTFLAQLISAGTLVAFMFVSLAMYRLRKREGKDLPKPAFKLPLYPVLPAITFVLVLLVFWGLSHEAKLYTLIWFFIGIVIYLLYGLKHSKKMKKKSITYQNNSYYRAWDIISKNNSSKMISARIFLLLLLYSILRIYTSLHQYIIGCFDFTYLTIHFYTFL